MKNKLFRRNGISIADEVGERAVEKGVIETPRRGFSRSEHPLVARMKVRPEVLDRTYQDLIDSEGAGQAMQPEDVYTLLKKIHRNTIQADMKARDTVYTSNERRDADLRRMMEDQMDADKKQGRVAFRLYDPANPREDLGPARYADRAAKAIMDIPPEERDRSLTNWLAKDATQIGEGLITKAATETSAPDEQVQGLKQFLPSLWKAVQNRVEFLEKKNLPKGAPSLAMRKKIPLDRRALVRQAIAVANAGGPSLPARMTAQKVIGSALPNDANPDVVRALSQRLRKMTEKEPEPGSIQKSDRTLKVAEYLEGRPHRTPVEVRKPGDGPRLGTVTPQQVPHLVKAAKAAKRKEQWPEEPPVTLGVEDYVRRSVNDAKAGQGVYGPSYETTKNAQVLLTAKAVEDGKMTLRGIKDPRTRKIVQMMLRLNKSRGTMVPPSGD